MHRTNVKFHRTLTKTSRGPIRIRGDESNRASLFGFVLNFGLHLPTSSIFSLGEGSLN